MSKLKPYTKYQPVDYDYVSQLPEGWQLLPNIAIFQERIERGHDTEELLSVTIGKGVIKQADIDIKKDSSNEDKSKYKLIKVGDIAYNRMRMWQGALGYSSYRGITSPAYVVLKPKMEINQRFFHYMFRTSFYTNYSKRFSYGIVDDQLSLRYTDFKRMYSIVPPLETQNSIVEYLYRKTQQIQEFISKKGRLIELLEEQKKVFILEEIASSKYITKKKKIKFVSFLSRGVDLSNENFKDGNYPVYGSNGIIGYHNKFTTKGPCITVGRSGSVGEVNYVDCDFWAHNTALYVCRNYKNDWKFIYYLMIGLDFKSYAAGSAVGTLNRNNIHQIYVDIPEVGVQKMIVKIIEENNSVIDNGIFKAKSEIEKAKEYQESLITQIVTGKIKVPESEETNWGQNTNFRMVAEPTSKYRSNN